jgi:hypothetical protein
LPSGADLNEDGATSIAASKPVRLVVIAGPVDCGKTTLLTSLYELFQCSPVSGYLFAGSVTLPAFERRCHLSRIVSGAAAPETPRTPYGEAKYLHLAVSTADPPRTRLELLFTDVSGEAFERARDSTIECQRLGFLKRADHFVMLLDGEKLVREEKRWRVVQDSMTLLQSCLDSGMLGPRSLVTVLYSKYDYLAAAKEKEHCAAFWADAKKRFERRFSSRVGRLQFGEIASRPMQCKTLKFGYGVPELLQDWVASSPRTRAMEILPHGIAGPRESEVFAARHFSPSTASK